MNTRRMTLSDLDWSTELLTDAFSGLPPATHMFRGAKSRSKLAYFMKCGGRYALLYGECHTTENHEAVAQWLLPGETRMTPSRMFKAGMFAAPMHFGLHDFKAFGSFVKHTDDVQSEGDFRPALLPTRSWRRSVISRKGCSGASPQDHARPSGCRSQSRLSGDPASGKCGGV